jgi:hypothetical protein
MQNNPLREVHHFGFDLFGIAILDDIINVKVLALELINFTLHAITKQHVVSSFKCETGNKNNRRKERKIRWKYSKMREGNLVCMQN